MARLGRAQPFKWQQRRPVLAAGVVNTTVTPGTGSLVLTGYAPILGFGITPSTGTLTLTGYAPVLNLGLTPSTASLTLTGFAPTVTATANIAVTPDTATLTLTGYAPDVAAAGSASVTPDTASLVLTGYAPTVTATSDEAPAATPDTRTLAGVPPGYKVRRRAEVRDVSGRGLVLVDGAGTATGEACLRGELLQPVEGTGIMVRETFRVLIGQIRTGAEGNLVREAAIWSHAPIISIGSGELCRERSVSGAFAQPTMALARMASECMAGGRLAIPSGGEAALTGQESDEAVIFAAWGLLTHAR